LERRKILIEGAVQGVGFRPFIHNLAAKYRLSGHIINTTSGVTIEIQGQKDDLVRFEAAIRDEHPPLAQPTITAVEPIPFNEDERSFVIRASQQSQERRAAITPDAAMCADCLKELTDPADRRWHYSFINCTNCGPRYTIIFDLPYDRHKTTMKVFRMCSLCQSEYDDPANRRFHAQPNACGDCGPHLWLSDSQGQQIQTKDPLARTIHHLEEGYIVAIKGLGGFHLAVRADSDSAVTELRRRKYRKAMAFALMVRDLEAAHQLAMIDPGAEELITATARPIVLCLKKAKGPLSHLVAPTSRFWGIMLPYTPLHTLLMEGRYPALVMTSGNNTDEPIENENASALKRLNGIADFFLMHNRDIYTRCDDSVVKVFQSKPLMIRRARGYVPQPISLKRSWNKDILAVGAELKNTVTYVKSNQAYTSQHIGTLTDARTYESFKQTIKKLGALIEARPQAVACDLHPAMLSTQFAERYPEVQLVPVQHHHAHIAAVMGEYNLEGPVVGLAADGIGYGSDETIWGGELLAVWRDRFERQGHLETAPMPGGDAASRQPWRMAISYLIQTYGSKKGLKFAHHLLKRVEPSQIDAVAEMAAKGINAPFTSSLGRFFDAVSALAGVCLINTYDAQAAIELENQVAEGQTDHYPIQIDAFEGKMILSFKPVVKAIVEDLMSQAEPSHVAGRFHNFVAAGLASMAQQLAAKLNTNTVALGGGVFQNEILLDKLVRSLHNIGLQAYFNRKLPVNDGSISFGQAAVADAVLAGRN